MNEKLTADILAVCNTLGYSDGIKYYQDPQCLDSAKALVLYLRRDTEEHEVRRLLGEAQVLQRDLIPIHKLKECNDDLFEVVLRLMVNLTNHALLVYEEELPKNKKYRNHYIMINRHLQGYKTAFLDDAFWCVICTKLKNLIQDMDILLENQKLTVERILIMIRNVLQIPSDPQEEMRNDDDASVHDQVLWVLYTSGIEDLLLFIASSDSTREFCMHVLEIIALFFREQTGEQLARTSLEKSLTDKAKDTAELAQCLRLENLIKAKKQVSGGRSFGGTFVVRGLDGPSGRNLICHKPVNCVSGLSLDSAKKTKKTPTNRLQIVEPSNTRRSTLSIRLMLKEFCVEFLNGAYNNLMRIVKDHLIRSKGQEHDETYYLFTMRFFMEFNRYYKFRVAFVSETMNTSTFHYVQGLIDNFHGLMVTEKENLILWSKRAHTALRAYQELLASLYVMEKVPGSMEASRGIQSTLFYLPEYRELCVGLLGNYEGAKWSRNYLCDLVDTNHLFLKMLESSTKEKRVLVKGTKRSRIPMKKKSRKSTKRLKKNSLEEWNCLEDELAVYLTSDFQLEAAIPFDAASDTPIDEQKGTALARITTHILKKDFNKAFSLYRAAREVWPDDDQLSKENEMSSLKSIFLEASPQPDDDPGMQESSEEEEDEEDEIDEEEDAEMYVSSRESEFDFRGFMEKYATPKIVANYGNLFKQYLALTPLTLHAILKMFHRYVFDMAYPALLCQATIFLTFQGLIKATQVREDLKDVHKFFLHFWSKFVKLAQSNPKIFIEILFWKTGREAQEIQEGYSQYGQNPHGSNGVKRIKSKGLAVSKTLSPEEENEIVVLAEEYASISEKTMKQVDWINEKLINGPKVKKLVSTFLAEKGMLLTSTKKKRQPWSESDVSQLRNSYEEFKYSRSVFRHISEKLGVKRSRNAIIDKMVEIQLIHDKSELSRRKNKATVTKETTGMNFLRENGVSYGTDSSSEDDGESSDLEDDGKDSRGGIESLEIRNNLSDSVSKNEALQKFQNTKNRTRILSESDSETEVSQNIQNKESSSRILSQSDLENEVSQNIENRESSTRIMYDSDSENEVSQNFKNRENSTRIISDSDSENEVSQNFKNRESNTRIVSDSDSENEVSQNLKIRESSTIVSDSDSGNEISQNVGIKKGRRRILSESDSGNEMSEK